MNFAMLFPGQGSQTIGMLADMALESSIVRATFDLASTTLGYDLWDVVCNGPVERLNQTEITQPAMLAAGVSIYRIWKERGGPTPTHMAGHSLGEYSALVCADALDYQAAVALVAERGRLMQRAVPVGQGAVAAVLGAADDVVRDACIGAGGRGVVEAVNFNAFGQVVIAGEVDAVNAALQAAKAAGAKRTVILPVSVPVHCSLMAPVAAEFRPFLEKAGLVKPGITVIHNVDGDSRTRTDEMLDALGRHLHSPVMWARCVERILADGTQALIECGPGKVLTGLNKRISRRTKSLPVFDPSTLNEALNEVMA